jgi:hypothetical protein
MKKALVLLGIVGLLALALSAQAVTTTSVSLQLYGFTNEFCSPIIPFNPHLMNADNSDLDYGGCFIDWMTDPGLLGSDQLNIIDPTTQSQYSFPSVAYDHPILMGEGFQGWVTGGNTGVVARTINYSGVDISDTDAWISLPGLPNGTGGLHHIGIPYPVGKTVDWTQIIVTDGARSENLYHLIYDLNDYSWGTFSFMTTDSATQSSYSVPDVGDPTLYGGQAYWIVTTKSNLALILPHPL